ncbi:type II secretion system protein GspM [Oxalicibacterium solurbis]|uniref:MSHA biogenesis protein MshJ n=1 Tax=Oxalicibacterium solurbis TaxID=69280 RepID=A0A8J3F831_9BURK|nr:type II secretion system protein GspM [Oxalicibacterium solurbis]GGI53088.1 hypothetical protein GCM10011430_02620 [Oxalicibacterium solurbis]
MKQSWQKLALRIDALTLRERAIIFAVAVLILVTLINAVLLDPQYAKQAKLSQQIRQQQAQIADIQNQIQQRVKLQENDPNQEARTQLEALTQRAQGMRDSLGSLQQELVSPDKIADLLESMLRKNDKLQLVSLKSLPVTRLNESVAEIQARQQKSGQQPAQTASAGDDVDAVYKHTVELTVQGGYLDMLAYVKALEKMPWRVFWENAQLKTDGDRQATLTLTLFTLSLDKKWLNL